MKIIGLCIVTLFVHVSCSNKSCYSVLKKRGHIIEKEARSTVTDWLVNNDAVVNSSQTNCVLGKIFYNPDELTMELVDSICTINSGLDSLIAPSYSVYSESIYSLYCNCSGKLTQNNKLLIFRFSGNGTLRSAEVYSDTAVYKKFYKD